MTQSWYDMIMSDEGLPEGCVLGETSYDLCGVEIEDLLSGKPVTAWNCQATMMTESPSGSGFLTDVMYLGRAMIPVFSPRLQQSLSAAKVAREDIQYLPIKVVQSTGITTSGFAIANILPRLWALDRAASFLLCEMPETDPETNQPMISTIGKIAVFESPFQGHDAARLNEFARANLVSQRFVDVYVAQGCTGACFSRLKHGLDPPVPQSLA